MNITTGQLPPLSDKCLLPPLLLADVLAAHPALPHPLVFRLTSPTNSVLVGVREFTAPENTVVAPQEVASVLGAGPVTATLAPDLPKALFLRVKPAQFYPHVSNWKYYLESFLSSNYTTLSRGQVFGHDAAAAVRLTVEDCNADAVVVVDTDIVLDVVPVNDVAAHQQQRQTADLAALENVPRLQQTQRVAVEPFSVAVPKVYALDLTASCSLRISTDSDADNVDVVAGFDKLVTLENFAFATMGALSIAIDLASELVSTHVRNGASTLYVVPFAWEHDASVTISVEPLAKPPVPLPLAECSNCGRQIASNLQLHEAHCRRNNVRCTCGEVFAKEIPRTHWRCAHCDVHGDSALSEMKHLRMRHSGPYVCVCGDPHEYRDFLELVTQHKATVCPAKLHECRFCHLVVPQEEATYEDRYANLSHHENQCGNKTTECFQCARVVRNKDLASHMTMHYMDKVERNNEVVARCTNGNCVSESDAHNDLGLCAACYGPLYLLVHDPTRAKLQNRIERRYMLQLTKGCGHSWCANAECATGGTKLDFKLAMQHVQTLLGQVAGLPVSTLATSRFWFCVNESVQMRKAVLDALRSEGHYADSMLLRAVNAHSDEEAARLWLRCHAVAIS